MRFKLVSLLVIITFILFFPSFAYGKIPFQANFMVTFFAPWNTMRFPGWEHGIPNKPIGIDNLNLFYPYKALSIDLLKKGVLPLWNPYNFSGNVLMANFQSAIFYPLNIIYFLLPMVDAWSVMVMIQPLLAGVFTYLFLTCFPIRKSAAIFGSIVFAFSGAMIVWIGDHLAVSHTMLWLPLILYVIERERWILGVFTLTTAIFAGFTQPLVYVFVTAFFYGIYRKKPLVPLFLTFGLGVGIGAAQLLPTWEAYQLSPRPTSNVSYLYDQFLMPLTHLISLLAPDYRGNPATYNFLGGGYHESMLYIGVAPLLLVFLAKKNAIVTYFALVAALSLALGFNLPPVRWLYELGIPIVSTFVPSRIFFLTSFALSVLAAFGYEQLMAQKMFGKLLRLSVVCLIILGVWYLTSAKGPVMQRNLVLPAFFLLLTAGIATTRRRIAVGLFVVMITGQLYFGYKYLSFSERQFVYPQHSVFTFLKQQAGFDRFWTYGDGYINANFATYYRIYSPDGTDALFPSRLGELFYASETKGVLAPSPRIDARIARASEGESMLDNPYRLRLLSLLGVKYITDWTRADNTQAFPASHFAEIAQFDDWHMYEYKEALPRVFLTNNVIVEKDPQQILDAVFGGTGTQVVLEEHVDVAGAATGSATIAQYSPNEVSVDIITSDKTLLFLSDTYYPGWKAYADGKPVNIYRANYAFRAVVVPKGARTIVFRYAPSSLRWAIAITAVSLSLSVLFFRSNRKLKQGQIR